MTTGYDAALCADVHPKSLFTPNPLTFLGFSPIIEAPCSKTSASLVESLQGIFDPQGITDILIAR
jgi:hypothetical protein